MNKLINILIAFILVYATNTTLFADDNFLTENEESKIELKVFPNPTTGEFSVVVNKNSVVQIFDIVGQNLNLDPISVNSNSDSKTLSFDLKPLPKGIYFVKVFDTSSNSQKMIKIKKL